MPRQTRPPEPDEEVIEIADDDLCTCGERFDEHEQVKDPHILSGPCQHPECDCEIFEPAAVELADEDEEDDEEEDETAEDYPEPDADDD